MIDIEKKNEAPLKKLLEEYTPLLFSDHYLHVLGSDPLGLINEGRLLALSQNLPLGAKSL